MNYEKQKWQKKKESRLQSYTHFLFIYLFVFAFDTSVINQVMALSYLKKIKKIKYTH